MIDVRFFQATATVIPTLAVAAALTSRVMDTARQRNASRKPEERKEGAIVLVGSLLAAVIVGESTSLAALVNSSHPYWNDAFFVVTIVAVLLILLMLVVITTTDPVDYVPGGRLRIWLPVSLGVIVAAMALLLGIVLSANR